MSNEKGTDQVASDLVGALVDNEECDCAIDLIAAPIENGVNVSGAAAISKSASDAHKTWAMHLSSVIQHVTHHYRAHSPQLKQLLEVSMNSDTKLNYTTEPTEPMKEGYVTWVFLIYKDTDKPGYTANGSALYIPEGMIEEHSDTFGPVLLVITHYIEMLKDPDTNKDDIKLFEDLLLQDPEEDPEWVH